jgi:hypothetical protein
VAKRNQTMDPRALRRWLDAGNQPHGEQRREAGSAGTASLPARDDRRSGTG